MMSGMAKVCGRFRIPDERGLIASKDPTLSSSLPFSRLSNAAFSGQLNPSGALGRLTLTPCPGKLPGMDK